MGSLFHIWTNKHNYKTLFRNKLIQTRQILSSICQVKHFLILQVTNKLFIFLKNISIPHTNEYAKKNI